MYFVRHAGARRSSAVRPSRWSSSSTAGSSPDRSPAPAAAGETEEHDRRLAAELVEHPKEVAEHVMLVDLARNDVGRVVEFGIAADRRDDDARALQPRHAPHLAGVGRARRGHRRRSTCCGPRSRPAPCRVRPKVRAMEIIDELEPVKRGPYAGVVGYLDFSGNIDTAIAIRTMVVSDNRSARSRPAPASSPTRVPDRRAPRVSEQGQGAARRGPGGASDDRGSTGDGLERMTRRDVVRVSVPTPPPISRDRSPRTSTRSSVGEHIVVVHPRPDGQGRCLVPDPPSRRGPLPARHRRRVR